MDPSPSYLVHSILLGVGATLLMDAWVAVRWRLLGIPAADYGLVGRWIAYMPRGRFVHAPIASTAPVRGERALGWGVHYLTGIAFAAALLAVAGPEWVRNPTLVPALAVGIVTVLAPFLLMQPGMGAGIAASRTRNPAAARLQSFVTHLVFGLGLYASGLLAHRVMA
jgi:hypothetical protein